jgi:hypothetical protein
MHCHNCGHHNPDHQPFCGACWTALPIGAEPDATASFEALVEEPLRILEVFASGELRDATALLVATGPGCGQRFLLTGSPVVFGRDPACEIVLSDVSVSRRHAQIRRERGRFWITDLGSLNGTHVNRLRIEVAQLASGDEVRMGPFRLLFVERRARP